MERKTVHNVVIETDGETNVLYTRAADPVARAEEIVREAGLVADDIYVVPDEELQYHCIDGRLWDADARPAGEARHG